MEDKNQNSVSNESSSQPVNPSPVNLSSSESNAANVQTQQVNTQENINQPQPVVSGAGSVNPVIPGSPKPRTGKKLVILVVAVILLVLAGSAYALTTHKSNKSVAKSHSSVVTTNNKPANSSCKLDTTDNLICYTVKQGGSTVAYSILFFPSAKAQNISGAPALVSTDQSSGSPEMQVTQATSNNFQTYCGSDGSTFTFTYQGTSETGCWNENSDQTYAQQYVALLTVNQKPYLITVASENQLSTSTVGIIFSSFKII
jgi:hypothetical protein